MVSQNLRCKLDLFLGFGRAYPISGWLYKVSAFVCGVVVLLLGLQYALSAWNCVVQKTKNSVITFFAEYIIHIQR